jgi:hypothetical protein
MMSDFFDNQGDFVDMGPLDPFLLFSLTAAISNSGTNSTKTSNGPVYIGSDTAAVTGFDPAIPVLFSDATTSLVASFVRSLYTEIKTIPPTNSNHPAAFVDGEVVPPGIYNIVSAVSMAGTVYFDAAGDSNAVWVLQIEGACALGAAVKMVLLNKALASNIIIICVGAYSAGAGCEVKGTMISFSGAIAIGAGCIIEGRLIAMTGAITTSNSVFSLPT